MNFKNLSGVSKQKRFCITCIELIFKIFVPMGFVFSLNFSLILIFRCKKHLKSFVFEILFTGDYSPTLISLMGKFDVYNLFSL